MFCNVTHPVIVNIHMQLKISYPNNGNPNFKGICHIYDF